MTLRHESFEFMYDSIMLANVNLLVLERLDAASSPIDSLNGKISFFLHQATLIIC
jgi:hypothetical protein